MQLLTTNQFKSKIQSDIDGRRKTSPFKARKTITKKKLQVLEYEKVRDTM